MNALQIIEPEKLHGDVFTMIGKEWNSTHSQRFQKSGCW